MNIPLNIPKIYLIVFNINNESIPRAIRCFVENKTGINLQQILLAKYKTGHTSFSRNVNFYEQMRVYADDELCSKGPHAQKELSFSRII